MRARSVIAAGAALCLAGPATAGAQDPGVFVPIMPSPPSPKQAKRMPSATFKVSLYGIQRFTQTSVERPGPEGPCWDSQGTRTSRSVIRFSTKRPSRAVITRTPLGFGYARWIGGDDELPLPVRASFEHSGKLDALARSCLEPELGWAPKPPPAERNCSASLGHLGFDLQFPRGKVEATSRESIIGPLGHPFEGCPWGDQSMKLLGAEQRFSMRELLANGQTQVILRFRDREASDGGKVRSVTTKQTTIYVTFKKARK